MLYFFFFVGLGPFPHIIIQVNATERKFFVRCIDFKNTEQNIFRQTDDNKHNRVHDPVYDPEGYGKKTEDKVRIDAENIFRQELGCHQDQQG